MFPAKPPPTSEKKQTKKSGDKKKPVNLQSSYNSKFRRHGEAHKTARDGDSETAPQANMYEAVSLDMFPSNDEHHRQRHNCDGNNANVAGDHAIADFHLHRCVMNAVSLSSRC